MPQRTIVRLAYLYLLRVPILIAFLLVSFPVLAVDGGSLTPLLENLFDLSPAGTFWVSVTAVLAAWSVMFTAALVVVNGSSRFGVPALFRVKALSPWVAVAALVLALPALAVQFLRTADFQYTPRDVAERLGAVLAGLAIAYSMAYAAMLVAVWLAPKGTQAVSLAAFPAWGLLKRWLQEADASGGVVGRAAAGLGNTVRTLPRGLWAGYLNPSTGEPWSGHWLAVSFAAVTFVAYEGVDLFKRLDLQKPVPLPAVMFVLWLFLCANWLLGWAAFFLDRFRIPLLVPFALAAWLASFAFKSDHYFALVQGTPHPRILAADVLQARAGDRPIVVVATAGGGIQAAVWTTQVLTGLQKDSLGMNPGSQKWPAPFAASLAMVSSVSGGAAGAMFFLNGYQDGPQPGFRVAPKGLDGIIAQAAASSLDDVAWALVDHDIPRLYFPYSFLPDAKRIDRGALLEQNWKRVGQLEDSLLAWRKGIAHCAGCGGAPPWRPAAIFNSTLVETGQPLLLGTTDLAPPDEPAAPRNFYDWFPGRDVAVETAVRLAATFPYVSPAARPDDQASAADHVVDGGYFDNYGVATLVEWLSEGLAQWNGRAARMPPILVIQIRSFPATPDPGATRQGAAFQLYAPISSLLNVRDTGQVMRDASSLRILQDLWRKTGGLPPLEVATLQFKGNHAPLSWAINPRQRQAVVEQWNQVLCGKETLPANPAECQPEADLQLVRCVMGAPAGADCAKVRQKGPW